MAFPEELGSDMISSKLMGKLNGVESLVLSEGNIKVLSGATKNVIASEHQDSGAIEEVVRLPSHWKMAI